MIDEVGMLVYDIPVTQRSTYNKLRRRIRRVSVPATWSCFLIPWGMKYDVEQILNEVTEEVGFGVEYRIIKFDTSDKQSYEEAAKAGFQQILEQAKKTLFKRLRTADEKQENLEYDSEEWSRKSRSAVKKARKSLEEARKIAVLFALSDSLELAFEGFDQLCDQKKQAIEAKLQGDDGTED